MGKQETLVEQSRADLIEIIVTLRDTIAQRQAEIKSLETAWVAAEVDVRNLQAVLADAQRRAEEMEKNPSDLASEIARTNQRYNDLWESIEPLKARLEMALGALREIAEAEWTLPDAYQAALDFQRIAEAAIQSAPRGEGGGG